MPPHPILSQIRIYPVKSLRGIALERARVTQGRLTGDRMWVLTDARGRFMHQRDYPAMAKLEVDVIDGTVTIRAPDQELIALRQDSQSEATARPIEYLRLWRRAAPVVAVGQEADEWFSTALGMPCRLMAFVPGAQGLDVPDYERDASLQDATPFHLTNEDSLADLNRRAQSTVPMNRFRPNVVVAGATPYAEDAWRSVRIGTLTLQWIRPCTRCAITMTDQQTGIRRGPEPLRTLSTYRRDGNEVVFGHYWVADSQNGTLQVGDRVTVLATDASDRAAQT